jgi:hypothetical protein
VKYDVLQAVSIQSSEMFSQIFGAKLPTDDCNK